jgi:hypothetical protein
MSEAVQIDPEAYDASTIARGVLKHLGTKAGDVFIKYFGTPVNVKYLQEERQRVLQLCTSHLGDLAIPVLWKAVEAAELPAKLKAIEYLAKLVEQGAIQEKIEPMVLAALGDAKQAAKYAPLAGKLATRACIEKLWEILVAKSKTNRAAAAEALAEADPQALDRAAGLQSSASKEARWGGVLALIELAAPQKPTAEAASETLLHRLKNETDADIRDSATRGLRAGGVAFEKIAEACGPLNMDELRARAKATKGAGVKWIAEDELPNLKLSDGTMLDRGIMHFLLYRQSRQADPIPDPEVAGLYRLIDRQTSGDFAHKLFAAFLENGPSKADAWALIPAALLGDNRVITALAAKVRAWADSFDQKLGTWGVEALALSATVPALAALHAIAEKFAGNTRRKFAVVGDAAQTAIENAARRLKVSLDELGDVLVPNMGFEPGRPRVIEAEKRKIEAVIGLDFKLAMKDLETGKKVASIPKAAPAELQVEFKGLGKLLTEVAKAQAARLERLMVRQYRWPAARWRELFQQQPVLFPFSVRLVWGAYDENRKLLATFRALPDRSMTDNNDEPYELNAALVGIVHPLELTAEDRDAWRSHLSDYEIEQPFLQIERQVVTVSEDLKDRVAFEGLQGAELNAFAFRGKVEKSGWLRAPAGEGMINCYRKRFDSLGVDAFVVTSGLTFYPDPSAVVKVDQVVFAPIDVKAGEFLSKRYKLGDVPAMAYSESVGELLRIYGKL